MARPPRGGNPTVGRPPTTQVHGEPESLHPRGRLSFYKRPLHPTNAKLSRFAATHPRKRREICRQDRRNFGNFCKQLVVGTSVTLVQALLHPVSTRRERASRSARSLDLRIAKRLANGGCKVPTDFIGSGAPTLQSLAAAAPPWPAICPERACRMHHLVAGVWTLWPHSIASDRQIVAYFR